MAYGLPGRTKTDWRSVRQVRGMRRRSAGILVVDAGHVSLSRTHNHAKRKNRMSSTNATERPEGLGRLRTDRDRTHLVCRVQIDTRVRRVGDAGECVNAMA